MNHLWWCRCISGVSGKWLDAFLQNDSAPRAVLVEGEATAFIFTNLAFSQKWKPMCWGGFLPTHFLKATTHNCTPSDQLLFYSLSLVLFLFLCWISCEYCVSISLITFKCGLRICLLVCCVIHFLHSCSPAFSGSHPHHLWKQGEKCLMSAFSGATVGYFAPLEVKQRVWMDLQLLLLLYFLLLCFAFSSCSYSVS